MPNELEGPSIGATVCGPMRGWQALADKQTRSSDLFKTRLKWMESMKHSNVVRAGLLISLCTLAGCGWFTRDRKEVYLSAEQGKALNVPSDLDSPARRDMMQIPAGATSQAGISEKPASSVLASAGVSEELFIDADPDQAFERVRDALEQSQIGTLGAIDKAARTIAVKVEIETVRSRWLLSDKVSRQEYSRVARVVADGAKSRVLVADDQGRDVDDDASKKILQAVRERAVD